MRTPLGMPPLHRSREGTLDWTLVRMIAGLLLCLAHLLCRIDQAIVRMLRCAQYSWSRLALSSVTADRARIPTAYAEARLYWPPAYDERIAMTTFDMPPLDRTRPL